MDCPHCGKAFHDAWSETTIYGPTQQHGFVWLTAVTICPSCHDAVVSLSKCDKFPDGTLFSVTSFQAYPKRALRKPLAPEVPSGIREDYEEACLVLADSSKASAALARRCLQAILRDQGYAQKDLAQQIDALLLEPDPAKAIPSSLRETVDAIRNFGNFSAHPVTDQTTLQVIAVEPGEAEWCLEILEEMFDHYFVRPAAAQARKAALDAKLSAAKKPPSK